MYEVNLSLLLFPPPITKAMAERCFPCKGTQSPNIRCCSSQVKYHTVVCSGHRKREPTLHALHVYKTGAAGSERSCCIGSLYGINGGGVTDTAGGHFIPCSWSHQRRAVHSSRFLEIRADTMFREKKLHVMHQIGSIHGKMSGLSGPTSDDPFIHPNHCCRPSTSFL